MRIIASLLAVALAGAGVAQARTISTRVALAPGRVDLARVRIAGFAPSVTPAQPALPERELAIALHPRAELATLAVDVKSGPTDSLAEGRALEPNPPWSIVVGGRSRIHWGEAGTVLGGRDLDAYGGRVFPAEAVRRVRVSDRRGLLVLHLRYAPLRYRHSTGELSLDRSTEVTVRYTLRAGGDFAPDRELLPHLGGLENAAEARAWYRAGAAEADTATKPGYAIVIPDVLAAKSTQLAAFIKQKEALGYQVTVVGDADRAAVSVGPKGGDAERIRGWLQASYKQKNLRHVLLIGNPDPRRPGVPMKATYAMTHDALNDPGPAPSDYYYADLTGNWDLDGDGYVAEYPEDGGAGGIDWAPEVWVGRIPIYDGNVKVLDSILAKTIAYVGEQGDRAWRKRVLQPAAMLFFKSQGGDANQYRMDGADVADPIYEQVIRPRGLARTTLYETAGVDISKYKPDLPLTRENVVAEWQKGYGLVTMVGHGSSDGIFRHVWVKDANGDGVPGWQEMMDPPFLSYGDLIKLDDTHPSIVFHNSCSNGTPEDADNLGAGLLRHGAIATVSSTRVAFVVQDSSIFNLVRDAVEQLLDNRSAGEALFAAKEKLSGKAAAISWFTRLEASLYGDPSVSLVSCGKDADCDDGRPCTGKETCAAGQCVPGKAVTCASDDPCTEASCDESTGGCKNAPRPDGEACDDHRFCTVDDRCERGQCRGAPRCAAPGNPCVAASCDEKTRACDVTPMLEGQPCHESTARAGICRAGICEPEPAGCALARAGRADGTLLLAAALLLLARRRRG